MDFDSGYAIAHYWYAEYLMAMGRTGEAIVRVERGLELDPLNSVINASLGMIRYLAHDFDGALVVLRKGSKSIPPTTCRICEWDSCVCRKTGRMRRSMRCARRYCIAEVAPKLWRDSPRRMRSREI